MINKAILLIAEYLYAEKYQQKIINELYNRTEYFEKDRMKDYNDKLFRFFSGKIARYAKENNQIRYELEDKDIIKLNEYLYKIENITK